MLILSAARVDAGPKWLKFYQRYESWQSRFQADTKVFAWNLICKAAMTRSIKLRVILSEVEWMIVEEGRKEGEEP